MQTAEQVRATRMAALCGSRCGPRRPPIELGRVLAASPNNAGDCPAILLLDYWTQCRHLWCIGASGSGKTEGLLKNIVYQHLLHGLPFCAIDPLGGLVESNLLEAIGAINRSFAERECTPFAAVNARRRARRETWLSSVLYLNLRAPDANGWVCNPLCKVPWLTIEEQVDLFLLSLVPLAGNFEEQRRMLSVARATLVTLMKLAELDGVGPPTLRDVFDFLVATDKDIQYFIACLKRRHEQGQFRFEVRTTLIEAYLEHFFATTKGRERNELVQSFINLLGFVYNDPSARQFLAGSQHSNLDFDDIVNQGEGKSLLVLLPDGLYSKRLLGSYIACWIERAAKKRRPADVKSGAVPAYSLIVDEAAEVFFSEHWCSTISTARNIGLRVMGFAHQSLGQFGEDGENILRTIRANSSVHVVFRVGWACARDLAAEIHKPAGQLIKRTERHVTDTESRAATVGESIGVQTSHAEAFSQGNTWSIAVGENETISVGEANGEQLVENESVSVTTSRGQARAVQKSTGYSVVLAQSQSESESEADGTAESHGQSHSTGNTTAFFESNGLSVDLGAIGLLGTQKENRGSGSSSGSSDSTTASLSRAISRVLGSARALSSSRAVGRSKSRGVTVTESGSEAESHGKAIARGLSQVASLMQSIGESVTRSTARQESRSVTQGQSHSLGQNHSESVGASQSVSERTVYYSVEEEIIIRANELSSLKPRTAWVVLNGEDTEAYLIRTFDMPQQWETVFAGKCYLEEFLQRSRGPALPPPPNMDLVPRIHMEMKDGR